MPHNHKTVKILTLYLFNIDGMRTIFTFLNRYHFYIEECVENKMI